MRSTECGTIVEGRMGPGPDPASARHRTDIRNSAVLPDSALGISSIVHPSAFRIPNSNGDYNGPIPMNLPNTLTISRIFLVPLLVVVLLTKFEGHAILGIQKELVAAGIFGLASITDWLDGYLARR